MSHDEAVRVALAAFPELRRLVSLRAVGGWRFTEARQDGERIAIVGVRTYTAGWADSIGVRYTTDAQAARCSFNGDLVWRRTGGLTEIVDALLDLPEPETRTAPRLAIATVPVLWVPGAR